MAPTCRFCDALLGDAFLDFGTMPLANSFLPLSALSAPEPAHPLRVHVCNKCWLVQLHPAQAPENIFSNYLYFSSYSDRWLKHAEAYAERMIAEMALDGASQVVELASNDGYLLRYFKTRGVPVLGVEPARNVAEIAIAAGVPTRVEFFGAKTAQALRADGVEADLLIANNVLAHVPAINDFVGGIKILLKRGGTATLEFPHLAALMAQCQFDTIYHEHFSYLSLSFARRLFDRHGLRIVRVERLETHGGSLRIFVAHAVPSAVPDFSVKDILRAEKTAGLEAPDAYANFARRAMGIKSDVKSFLAKARADGLKVAGYGAPAKGNTLLNACGITSDLMPFTVDRSPHKQGLYLPGSHIPILPVEAIRRERPDFVFILPWNLKEEIVGQVAFIREWGGRFVVPIPRLEVF